MKNFSAQVLAREEIAENTIALQLSKPEGFHFVAGQYCTLGVTALVSPDDRGERRCMSIASAPYEEHLLFAMRLSESGFKRSVAALREGDVVSVSQPVGFFTLPPEDTRPIIFLVGGIGITPVRSILRQAVFDRDTRDFSLFYSNYRPDDTPFLEEVRCLSELSYRAILTMTNAEESAFKWEGERGYLTREFLERHISDFSQPLFYIVGTSKFTEAMNDILLHCGVEKTSLRQDPFVGL